MCGTCHVADLFSSDSIDAISVMESKTSTLLRTVKSETKRRLGEEGSSSPLAK